MLDFPSLPKINPFGIIKDAFIFIWEWAPLWLPIVLLVLFFQTHMRYIRTKYIFNQKRILLEIKLPKDVVKSPRAMEVVLGVFHQPSVGNIFDVYIKGKIRTWFSLEIVSIGGEVHFFIWVPEANRNIIESQIYSQYPQVEISQVSDYSLDVKYGLDKISLWGAQLILTKPDVYPIKTYIDYELEKDVEDSKSQVDPMTPVIEFLGSLKPGEQAWIQILIQAHRAEGIKDGRIQKKLDWSKEAKKEIEKIMEDAIFKPEEGKKVSGLNLSETQRETIKSIERGLSKPAFDTMVRMLYIAEKEIFNPVNIGGLLGSFKQYSSNTLNGFKPKFTTEYDFPWQDFRRVRRTSVEKKILDAYKRRSFFQIPYKNFKGRSFVLNSEELATIFHFPGETSETPTFTRITSRKSEPPSNLPI